MKIMIIIKTLITTALHINFAGGTYIIIAELSLEYKKLQSHTYWIYRNTKPEAAEEIR